MHLTNLASTVLLILLHAITATPLALRPRGLTFDYDQTKVRGVNLGGWFVLEPWITPSIFEAVNGPVDEFSLCQTLGHDVCLQRLTAHWNSWIQAADFTAIAAAGMNHVRIPIGYWAVAPLAGEPYVQGQLNVLDNAIGWARNAGLKVLIDLHGAPGSQNGFDNSGHNGTINWLRPGTNTDDPTKAAINGLAQRYALHADVVTAIELVNEPAGGFGVDLGAIQQFYKDGWGVVRASGSPAAADTVVVIHDAFQDPQSWNGFMDTASGMEHVMLDTHQYQVFSDAQLALSPAQHVGAACQWGPRLRATDKWTVVGEWSAAMTDCAKYLNGFRIGARYDGSKPLSTAHGSCAGKSVGTVAGFAPADRTATRQFIEAQLDAYEQHTGESPACSYLSGPDSSPLVYCAVASPVPFC